MKTVEGAAFYLTRDRVLARIRHDGYAVPEVFNRGEWSPYPALDTIHDARPISTPRSYEAAGCRRSS